MARNSIVMICKNIKLDKGYQNVLTYTEEQMRQLCYNNRINMDNNFSFVEDAINTLLVPFSYSECLTANYMAFQNPRYSNKWFFAFIDSVDYVSEKATRINYTIDNFSTWYEYWTAKQCFVVREHVMDDTVGLHTLPEQLELGEYIIQSGPADVAGTLEDETRELHYLRDTYMVVATTEFLDGYAVAPGTSVFNGIYSGLYYLVFRSSTDCDKFITDLQDDYSADVINSIFIIPKSMCDIPENAWYTPTGKTYELAWYPGSTGATKMTTDEYGIYIAKPDHLDTNYVPVNKKLLTFPYCYLLVSNNAGSIKDYRYEFFNTNTYCQFDLYGSVSPGCSIKLFPIGYNMKHPSLTVTDRNNYEGIDAPKLPTCSWTNDTYTNWLTQQSVNMPMNTIKNVGSIVAGGAITLATGGAGTMIGAGLIIGGSAGIFDQMKQRYEHSLVPDSAKGGANQGNLVFSLGDTFTMNRVSIRKEYAECIDNYFSKFGYQINRTKLPNQTGRRYFNYVEIGKSEIIGYPNNKGCPADAMEQINNMYRSGITLWHDHDRIGNYADNTIITP